MIRRIQSTGLWTLFILLALGLVAQTVPAADSMEDATQIAMGTTDGGVMYMHGGVGKLERDRMTQKAGQYNLKVVSAATTSDYLALLDVRIADADGNTVLHIDRTEGPWVFAKLPAGSYTVRATYEGETKSATVNVGARLKTVQLRWKIDEAY